MEDDLDLDLEHPFIGRADFLTSFRSAWMKNRVFGVFGQKSVGKSRTVKELLARLQSDVGDDGHLKVVSIELHGVTSMETLRLKVLLPLGFINEVWNDAEDWVLQMCRRLDTDVSHAYILSFDNAEDCLDHAAMKEDFMATCKTIIWTCRNTRIILSSTTKVIRGLPFFFWQDLPPMNTKDGSQLIKSLAPDVHFGDCLEKIVKLCCGLPLALIIAVTGYTLNQPDGVVFSPAEMVDILSQCRLSALSSESYLPEEQVGAVYRNFIQKLTKEFQQRLAVLGYIPGSFTDTEASQLLAHPTTSETRQQSLNPLLRRYMVEFEPKSRRYNIHGILQDCLEVYFNIENLPEVRKRYCRLFGRVLGELSGQMETAEYLEAYTAFLHEYPNLTKLLTDVVHSTQETFPFYIEMAASSSNLIIQFFGNESMLFFNKCFELAHLYGKERDRALAMTHYGRALTNVKSDLAGGKRMLTGAVSILELSPPSESLASVLESLGWTSYLQGQIPEAIKHYSRGLEVVKQAHCENSLILLRLLNCLGLANNAEGRFADAETHLLSALRKYKQKLGDIHPIVGSVYNNIGVVMTKKEDHERATMYYELGLQVKRQSNAPVIGIIASICNVSASNGYLGRFIEAKSLIKEGIAILDKAPELYRAERSQILDTLGRVCRKEGKYLEAIKSYKAAVDIRRNHFCGAAPHIKSLIALGGVYKDTHMWNEALEAFTEALEYHVKAYEQKTDMQKIYDCYMGMVVVFTEMENPKQLEEAYDGAAAQLKKLIHMYETNGLDIPAQQFKSKLDELRKDKMANSLLSKSDE